MSVCGWVVCNGGCFEPNHLGDFCQFIDTLEKHGVCSGATEDLFKVRVLWPKEVFSGSKDAANAASAIYSRYSRWINTDSLSSGVRFFVENQLIDSVGLKGLQIVIDNDDLFAVLMVVGSERGGREIVVHVPDHACRKIIKVSLTDKWAEIRHAIVSWYCQHHISDKTLVLISIDRVDDKLQTNLQYHLNFLKVEPFEVHSRASSSARKQLKGLSNNPKRLLVATRQIKHAHTKEIDCHVLKSQSGKLVVDEIEELIRGKADQFLATEGISL